MRRSLVLSFIPVAAALASAGCGSRSATPNVASLTPSTTTTQTAASGMVAFAQCMRSHGVANFPDPQNFAGGNVKLTIHQVVGNNPRYQPALNACSPLLPTGGSGPSESPAQLRTQLADELSFARCMRSRGIGNFPDPKSGPEGLTVRYVESQGIDVHSPAVLRVVQKCIPASHGGLTLAKVREAIANHP